MTLAGLTILSARRAYEFRIDELRLSMLCTSPVNAALKSEFHFQSVIVAAPPAVFGEVQPTSPPGLVCQIGEVEVADGGVVPVRALMFDALRTIIDVAGPSNVIDVVWKRLVEVLGTLSAPDGQPILGQPSATADQSDFVFNSTLPQTLGLNPDVLKVIEARMPEGRTLIPTLFVRANAGDLFPSSPQAAFVFEPRGGSSLADNHWFSSAPLQTDAHTAYLEDMEAAIARLASR